MNSDNRYPNPIGSPMLGFRRVSFGLMTSPSQVIDSVVFESFFEYVDTWTANYAPPAPAVQEADWLGDWGYPNQYGESLNVLRRTRMRPSADDGLDNIITLDFLGAPDVTGTGAGSQSGYLGSGTGTVTLSVPVVTTPVSVGASGGGGAKRPKNPFRPWSIDPPKKVKLLKLPEEPGIVYSGSGGGIQGSQLGSGSGTIVFSGRSLAWQTKHGSRGVGVIRVTGRGSGVQNDRRIEMAIARRRREEEMLINLLLRAA
jgi:hypothetical protein